MYLVTELFFNSNYPSLTGNVAKITSKRVKKQTASVNLIDLDTWIEKDNTQSNLSIVDLFDPLSQVNISQSAKEQQVEELEEEVDEEEEKSETDEVDSEQNKQVAHVVQELASRVDVAKAYSLQRSSTVSSDSVASQPDPNRIENFKLVEQFSNLEFESFNKSINKLSQELKVDSHKKLSNLIVFSPLLDCPLTNQRKNIKIVVRYSNSETNRFLQQNITPSINATVETVVYHVLGLFGINDLDTSKSNFGFMGFKVVFVKVRTSPDRIGPAIFEVPKNPGDILTLND